MTTTVRMIFPMRETLLAVTDDVVGLSSHARAVWLYRAGDRRPRDRQWACSPMMRRGGLTYLIDRYLWLGHRALRAGRVGLIVVVHGPLLTSRPNVVLTLNSSRTRADFIRAYIGSP